RAGSEQGPGLGYRFEVQADVGVFGCQEGRRGTTRSPGLQGLAVPDPPRPFEQYLERRAERKLVVARLIDLAADREDLRPGRLLGAEAFEPVGAVGDDVRDR